MDRNITNFNILKNTAECISKICCQGYIKDLTSYHTQAKRKPRNRELNEEPQSIFDLEGRNRSLVLQSTTLLNSLLKQNFTSKPGEILQLQLSDLQIRDIYNLVEENKTTQFVLVNKILYKKNGDILVLVVPELLGSHIIFQCNNRLGFHFSRHQMDSLLKPLEFSSQTKNCENLPHLHFECSQEN